MGSGEKRPGIALALSGGGYRATLFHLGAFWRLNELGYLPKLSHITSVSGGSIASGVLGHRWNQLEFNEQGIATNFTKTIAAPIQSFCKKTIDVPSVLGGWLSIVKRPSELVSASYRKHLFGNTTLQDLPSDGEGPRFIYYATNLQTGASFRFSKPYMGGYHIGRIFNPTVKLADVVAASSAFPPVLTPLMLKTNPSDWKEDPGSDLFHKEALRKQLYLSDGGVYDNLGLEAASKFETVLVSDAGAPFSVKKKPWLLKFSQVKKTLRVLDITVEQTRALRKRHLVQDYIDGERKGTYWGIATDIDDYHLVDPMVKDNAITAEQQKVETRLKSFNDKKQGRLINWGYALADAAMRKHVLEQAPQKGVWPIPKYALG